MSEDKLFYILSLKWTKPMDGVLTFWREDNSGYCRRLDWAGKYTEKQIKEKPEYYNDGKNTVAIPCEIIDNIGYKAVIFEWEHIDELKNAAMKN